MSNQSLIPYDKNAIETLEEALSRQFYAWEKLGRGWQVYDYPVEIEPPPRPFYFAPPPEPPAIDDGQVHTFFSRLLGGGPNDTKAIASYNEEFDEYRLSFASDIEADPCQYCHERFVEIRILLPEDSRPMKTTIEQFISSLDYTVNPISFEVIGTSEQVVVQFCATAQDIAQLRQQFAAHFPQGSYIEGEDHLVNTWINAESDSYVVDFGLSEEFFLPLASVNNIETDPLIAVVGAMADFDEDEVGVFQVLFKKVGYNWPSVVTDAITRVETTEFFSYIPDIRSLVREKLRSPFYATVVRVAAKSEDEREALRMVRNIAGALNQIARPGGNELIPLSNEGYDDDYHVGSFLDRMTMRSGMLLNRDELVSLVHPPASSVRTEKLARISSRTRPAPAIVLGHSLQIGTNVHQGEERIVSISDEQRTRHMHVIGSSGSGKSTLLLSMIKQDMDSGHGLCVLDPHGDLIDDVIRHIPDSRIDDVIVFDPSDADFPVAFNILEAKTELEKTILSSDLIATFRRMSTSWGDVMDSVLANAILAFVENSRGGTLFDLKRFLVEQKFRDEILQTVRDPGVQYFWRSEFPLISGKPQSSILIRLDAFLRQKLIRDIVCQKDMRFNFREAMDKNKILLLKLSQGLIGEENAYLLGTLLVSKIYQTALTRQDSTSRPHFWMYIDEFHHFITPSMENILSGARKYNLGLVLAHQEFRQLQSRSQEVASSVLSNCYSRICFSMGDTDAERFAGGFSFFDKKALQNLGVGEAVARVERAEYDFNLQTTPLSKVPENVAGKRLEAILQRSRAKFGGSKVDIEFDMPVAANITAEKKNVAGDSKLAAARTPSQEVESEPKVGVSERAANNSRTDGHEEHRYLQNLIKRIGEKYGYIATIEKEVFGGIGRIDVALENERHKIACEVAITNTTEYETQNIQKCLSAGFTSLIVISSDARHLQNIKDRANLVLSPVHLSRVHFLEPENLHLFLESLPTVDQSGVTEEKIKGYTVKSTRKEASLMETKTKRGVIADIYLRVAQKLQRTKRADNE